MEIKIIQKLKNPLLKIKKIYIVVIKKSKKFRKDFFEYDKILKIKKYPIPNLILKHYKDKFWTKIRDIKIIFFLI